MRKKRSVPGCSALSLRYWSSIGVDSIGGGLAGDDVVGEAALPPQALAQGARFVAGAEGSGPDPVDGRGLTAFEHLDVAHARDPEVLRERIREIPAREGADLDRVAAPDREAEAQRAGGP